MKYVKSSRRASKRRAASRHRRMKLESLEPRQMLAANPFDVVISEVMYHALDPTDDEFDEGFEEEREFEYVELFNRGTEAVDLTNWRFNEGFDFDFIGFAAKEILPGQHLLIVHNLDAFEMRYEDVSFSLLLGEFAGGSLKNNGEDIELLDALGNTIALLDYTDSDPWPTGADGKGSSLQIVDNARIGNNDLYRARNWIASRELEGTPGAAGLTVGLGVVINEVLSNSDDNIGELDQIELFNTTETAIDIGGLFLTDKNDFTEIYQIPAGTIIPAEGYIVFDENQFNPDPGDEGSFALSSAGGETLSLLEVTDDPLRDKVKKVFIDSVEIDASETSRSVGRLPNGRGVLFPLEEQSFGAANTLPVISDLVISEIQYHPTVANEPDDEDVTANLEFIEILNRSDHNVSTNPPEPGLDWRLRKDIDFDLPNVTLAPGERLLVLRFDPSDFENRDLRTAFELFYDIPLNVVGGVKAVGGYGGADREELDADKSPRLSNSGAEIELQQEVRVSDVEKKFHPRDLIIYRDKNDWPNRPDGGGSSLERKGPELFGNDPDSWRPSNEWNGTPGTAGQTKVDVIINEALTHTDQILDPDVADIDAIELYNTSDAAVDVSGWWLSDSGNDYDKFKIPEGSIIEPGEYLLFDEDDFNSTRFLKDEDDPTRQPGEPFRSPKDFAFSSARGETLWLLETDAVGDKLRFADRVRFGAALNGESFGRIPNGDPNANLFPNKEVTLGAENSGPRVGPLVITEIMYNPPLVDPPLFEGFDGNDLEYIEITNPTDQDVDLTEWHLDGGVDLKFAAAPFDPNDPNNPPPPIIKPGESVLVLSFNPDKPESQDQRDAFRTFYGIGAEVQLFGGYSGSLANGGERVELQRADSPPSDAPDFFPRLLEDEVRYDDVAPWPTGPDGGGVSLNRKDVNVWGRQVDNWTADVPSPGSFNLQPTKPVVTWEALSPFEVRLSWSDSRNETGYRVFQHQGEWVQIATLGIDETSFVVTGLSPGSRFRYSVEAHSQGGSAFADTITATTPSLDADFGDAPDSYRTTFSVGGAYHLPSGPTLGATRDTEADGQPTAAADGDGQDEDGVVISSLTVGQRDASITITVQGAPAGAKLDAWIDIDGNGDWDGPLDQIANSFAVVNGENTILFDVSGAAVAGDTYARFRLSTSGNLDPGGAASDGEVEDYAVTILPDGEFSLGDLNLNGAVDFQDLTILLANWNKDVGAESGNLVDTATTPVNFADLTVLLAEWTGPLAAGAPGAQAVADSSAATSAVFDQIGEVTSSDDPSRLNRSARRGTPRREGSQMRRLQATVVDRAMTEGEDDILPLRSRSARRRGR